MEISHFLEKVTSQIQSKEAKEFVKVELSQHIQKSKQSWVRRGYSEIEAEEKAVNEMGSPLSLGKSLNQLHKPKIDWLLITLLSLALLLSFLSITALNHGPYLEISNLNVSSMFQNKVIFIVLGLILAIGIMYFDYRKLEKFGYWFYGAGIGLTIVISHFGNEILNGELIISIGIIEIQIWMAIPLFLLAWASLFSNSSFKLWQGIGLYVFSIFLLLNIPSLSMIFMYSIIVAVLFLLSRFTLKEKVGTVGITALIVMGIIGFFVVAFKNGKIASYQVSRLLGFINPDKYADGSGYIYVTLENAVKSGGIFGTDNVANIPDPHTNLVFGNLLQTYGYAIGVLVFIVLSAFLVRFWLISRSIKDPFGKLLILGSVTLFTTQFFYNVGMNFGLLPVTSITLPFMSYGLMPTLLNAFIVGIALSVYRRKQFMPMKKDYMGI